MHSLNTVECGFFVTVHCRILKHKLYEFYKIWIFPYLSNFSPQSAVLFSIESQKATESNKKCNLTLTWAHLPNIMSLRLTLSQVTFALDPWPWPRKPLTMTTRLERLSNETKITFFYLDTLTFDTWPWPLRPTLGSSTFMPWQNFMTLVWILFSSLNFVTEDRQTYVLRRHMTHTDVCSLCASRNGMRAPFAPPIFHTYEKILVNLKIIVTVWPIQILVNL